MELIHGDLSLFFSFFLWTSVSGEGAFMVYRYVPHPGRLASNTVISKWSLFVFNPHRQFPITAKLSQLSTTDRLCSWKWLVIKITPFASSYPLLLSAENNKLPSTEILRYHLENENFNHFMWLRHGGLFSPALVISKLVMQPPLNSLLPWGRLPPAVRCET